MAPYRSAAAPPRASATSSRTSPSARRIPAGRHWTRSPKASGRSTSRPCCCGGPRTRCFPTGTCATSWTGCRRPPCTASRARATCCPRTATSPPPCSTGSRGTPAERPKRPGPLKPPAIPRPRNYLPMLAELDGRRNDHSRRGRRHQPAQHLVLVAAGQPRGRAGPRAGRHRGAPRRPGQPAGAPGDRTDHADLCLPAPGRGDRGGRRRAGHRGAGPRHPRRRTRLPDRHRPRPGRGPALRLARRPDRRRSAARRQAQAARRGTHRPGAAGGAEPGLRKPRALPRPLLRPTRTPMPRCSSPPAPPARPRASCTRTAGSPPCATPSGTPTGCGPAPGWSRASRPSRCSARPWAPPR